MNYHFILCFLGIYIYIIIFVFYTVRYMNIKYLYMSKILNLFFYGHLFSTNIRLSLAAVTNIGVLVINKYFYLLRTAVFFFIYFFLSLLPLSFSLTLTLSFSLTFTLSLSLFFFIVCFISLSSSVFFSLSLYLIYIFSLPIYCFANI